MNGEGLFNTWWKITLLILGLLLIAVLPGFAFPTWYSLGQDDEYVFTGEPPAALNIRRLESNIWAAETNLPAGDWGYEKYKFRLEKLDADGNNMVKEASWMSTTDGATSQTITLHANDHGLNTGDIVVISFMSATGAGTSFENTEAQSGSYKVFSVDTNSFQVTLKISVSKGITGDPFSNLNNASSSYIYWYKSSCNGEDHDQNTPSQCKTGTSKNPLPLGFDPQAVTTSALATANYNGGVVGTSSQPIVYALQGPWENKSTHDSSNKKIYFKIVGKDLVFDVQHNNYFPYENEDLPTGFSINFDETTSSLTTTLMEQGAGKIYSNAIVKPDDKLYLRFMECTSLANGDLSGCDKSKSLGYITVPKELKPVKK